MRHAEKSPDAFRTISEVAEELDLPQHVLRFWETKFAHIRPMKRAGGRRYYRPEDVDLLKGIRTLLYTDGFTIKGVQKILREQGLRYVIETGRLSGDEERPLPVSHTGSLEQSEPSVIVEEDAEPVARTEEEVAPRVPNLTVVERVDDPYVTLEEMGFEPVTEQVTEDEAEELAEDEPNYQLDEAEELEDEIEDAPVAVEEGISPRQRAALESILSELNEMKLTLDGAKKSLGLKESKIIPAEGHTRRMQRLG